ncbi:MAG: NnrS family protein, partial [Giesbergeria sp.]
HRAFGWAIAGLALLVAGFYFDALRGAYPMRWLHAFLGLLMVLIVVAMSRISMRIVNRAIDQADTGAEPYLARPPRRNLAVLCIALFTLAEFLHEGSRTSGWLACASAAAVFNLLGDWHVGRPLLRRWPLMLYAVYLCMALGYALMGWALLTGGPGVMAGRHLLTVGTIGLAIYAVICIAGRAHCGLAIDERAWGMWGAGLIALAALLRAGAAWMGEYSVAWMALAGLCWMAAFGLLCAFIAPVLLRAREDGLWGCEG